MKKDQVAALSPAAIAADGNVGFEFLSVIFDASSELMDCNPALAKRLVEAGSYWADSLRAKMERYQDGAMG